jgi:uncharacterized RDD family membrane protein YckC
LRNIYSATFTAPGELFNVYLTSVRRAHFVCLSAQGEAMTPDLSTQPGMGRCEITGKIVPEDELVVINGQRVCAEGKAILLERLKAGEALPGEAERPTALRRFACIVVDGVIWWVINVGIVALFVGVGFAAGMRPGIGVLYGVAQLVVTAIVIGYFALMHGIRGQSLGKMAGKLKVVRVDGRPMDLQTGFIRALAFSGPSILPAVLAMVGAYLLQTIAGGLVLLYFFAQVLVALLDRSQQRSIHDRIAGTRVVVINA